MVRGKTEREEGDGGEMSKLTRDEIMARWDASTSRERDAWVAKKVMGLTMSELSMNSYPKVVNPNNEAYIMAVDYYSTEISAAMEIVEKLKHTEGFKYFCVSMMEGGKLTVGFILGEKTSGTEPMLSLSEGICKAALLVMEGKG